MLELNYKGCVITISDEDAELFVKYRWRINNAGFVVEDLDAYEDLEMELPEADRKANQPLLLHVEVAKRMEIYDKWENTRIRHKDSNQFNNTRDNLDNGKWVETDPVKIQEYKEWWESVRWIYEKFM